MPEAVQKIAIQIQESLINCTIKRSKNRRRTLSMQMHPRDGVLVQVPWRATQKEVHEFISVNHEWILKHEKKFKAVNTYTFTTGEQLLFLGEPCHLTVTESHTRSRCDFQENAFHVTLKPNLEESVRQQKVYELIKKWFYKKAHAFLSMRLAFWEEKLQVKYHTLKITNPRQRWGCCDTHNNIRINWRIMLTPLDLIDYLLVHELCHIPHKNHSRTFWKLVGSVLPDYNDRRRRLHEHPANYF